MDKEKRRYSQGYDQGYAMQDMHGQNTQRDTYGLPYHNNNNNNNGYGHQADSQQQYNQHYQQQQQPAYYNNGYHNNDQDTMIQANRAPADLDADLPPLPPSSHQHQHNNNNNNHRMSVHSSNSNNINSQHPKPVPVSLIKAPKKERSKCLPCFPCIRSTCGRVTCCLCLVLLLAIIIIVIVIFTVFKMPTVDYLGTVGTPTFTFNTGSTTFGVDLVADIQVMNPNPIGFNFELIAVTAYFPGYAPALGGGNVTHVSFPSKSTRNVQFPISVAYDRHMDPGFTVVQNILSKCGILGGSDGQLTINYDIKATVKIIGISITPNIKNQSTSFACPVNIAEIAKEIPGGIASIIGDIGSTITSA
ncbi:hypothetical protein BGX33_009192, partial [Mortierella sp. NVP41]